jgi:predicted esterase
MGCSDVDPHIPKERVESTAELMRALGADVTMCLSPNMDHTVNRDEIAHVQAIMSALVMP